MTTSEREARAETDFDTRRRLAVGALWVAGIWVWAFAFHILFSIVEF